VEGLMEVVFFSKVIYNNVLLLFSQF